MTGLVLPLIVVLVLLGLLFFTALADGALRALNQIRLRTLVDEGVGRADAMDRLLTHPHRITSTTVVINTFALAGLAATTVWIALQVPESIGYNRLAVIVAIILLGFLVLIFGQVLPRSLALRNPERTALIISRPLNALAVIVRPVTWIVERTSNLFIRLLGFRNAPRNPFITEDELRMLVNAGEREGVLEQEEREMITGILRFGDMEAHEVMVPRPDVVAVPATMPVREALDVALSAGHSRMPLYDDNIDTILGVLYTKDLIEALLHDSQKPLVELSRPAIFIPETKKLGDLLAELQSSRVHMAIVVDEYGGTAGLVTIEDLLEEIVGEIQDEYDVELPDIEQVDESEWVALGRIDLDDVNEVLGVELDSEDYDTLGGYITAQLERLPVVGDEIEAQGVRMRVLDTIGRRIGHVLLQKLPPATEAELDAESA